MEGEEKGEGQEVKGERQREEEYCKRAKDSFFSTVWVVERTTRKGS